MVLLHTPPGELGSPAPDFNLPGVDGRNHALADYADAAVLVVMFICNHCPYVQAVEERLIALGAEMRSLGVAMVGINSNDPDRYPEDSPAKMGERARQQGYTFDYLFDGSQEVARSYGAVCTPDFFVYDRERRLRYRGRLDDAPRQPAAVRQRELRAAILALLAGEPVAATQHPAMGCSIKWREE